MRTDKEERLLAEVADLGSQLVVFPEAFIGSQSFRQRLLLSTLSSTPILISEIRDDDMIPGLRPYEISLLRLFETVSDD
ncbi:hypothetical protein AALP_AAs64980U000100 [Arabis alpina]|uniref:RNA 3'-terminal phosphate cyclase domain-containing protein n=1 Tax=Arabis alpina TaxID=50452 RepID=A0A087FXW2_ARAAL|nr:hypothetical protein AALP_AAs64980U000100 [Arabis alpina]